MLSCSSEFSYLSLTILQVSVNPKPASVSLNQDDDKKIDTANPLGENLRSDAPSIRSEVPTDDQTNDLPSLNYNDAPNRNAEVAHPTPAESAVSLSNQGMKTRIISIYSLPCRVIHKWNFSFHIW